MLLETQDLSLSAGAGIRLPTGDEATGGDVWIVSPQLAVWHDIGNRWSLRGGVAADLRAESSAVAPDMALIFNAAISHTVTDHDQIPWGNFTYYLAANVKVDLDSSEDHTFVSLTPGVRTHVGDNAFLVTGVEVELTNPDVFDQRYLLLLVVGF